MVATNTTASTTNSAIPTHAVIVPPRTRLSPSSSPLDRWMARRARGPVTSAAIAVNRPITGTRPMMPSHRVAAAPGAVSGQ